jgi:hypothetical protein
VETELHLPVGKSQLVHHFHLILYQALDGQIAGLKQNGLKVKIFNDKAVDQTFVNGDNQLPRSRATGYEFMFKN